MSDDYDRSHCNNKERRSQSRSSSSSSSSRKGSIIKESLIKSEESFATNTKEPEERAQPDTIPYTKEAAERVQPDTIPSSVPSSSTAPPAPAPVSSSSTAAAAPAAPAPAANTASTKQTVAFIEKDLIKKYPEEEEGDRDARKAAVLPETITSAGDAAVISNNSTINNENRRKQGSSTMMIKSEEIQHNNGGNPPPKSTKRKRERKQHPSLVVGESININESHNNDSFSKRTKDRKKNQRQGGRRSTRNQSAVANNTNNHPKRTSPRNKQHQEEEEDQTNTILNNDNAADKTNCCRFCNDPDWENKIYYKCGTVLSKYFPKSDNNPNPGWYKGTISMHSLDSVDSDDEVEEEADTNSNGHSIYNQIRYEDGDMENITQDDLKHQLTKTGRKQVVISSNSSTNTVDSKKHDQKWQEKFNTLLKFKEEKGHTRVPRHYKEDQSLGNWVFTQRDQYKKGNLPPNRLQKLQDIDFDWDAGIGAKTTFWQESYDKLKQFKANHGNTRVPHKYVCLFVCLNNLRCVIYGGKNRMNSSRSH